MIDDNEQRQQGEATPRLQPISFFSIGGSGSGALGATRKSGLGIGSFLDQDASGGLTPAKKSHEMTNPTQTTKPNSNTM